MKYIAIVIGIGLVGAGIFWAVSRSPRKTVSENINIVATTNVNSQVAATNDNTNQTAANPSAPAKYASYSTAAEATARESGGKTVLYFHADWCPVCQVLEPDIRRAINAFPDGLTILKVNYDTATDLKKKYGVTYQHTFVQIDEQGKLLKIWSGGTTSDSLTSQLL